MERKIPLPRCGAHGPSLLPEAFTEVKVIDDLVAQLLKEKGDEIKHKEFCVEEFNSKQLQTKRTDRENEDLIAKIEDLEFTMKTVD